MFISHAKAFLLPLDLQALTSLDRCLNKNRITAALYAALSAALFGSSAGEELDSLPSLIKSNSSR